MSENENYAFQARLSQSISKMLAPYQEEESLVPGRRELNRRNEMQ